MNEPAKFGTPEFFQRLNEFADRMTTERLRAMAPEEITAVMREYTDFLENADIPRPHPGWQLEAFATQLAIRQGTFLQDFQAFYRKRDELDRELLGD